MITATYATLRKQFTCYLIQLDEGRAKPVNVWVGVSKVSELLDLADARKHAGFRELIRMDDKLIVLLFGYFETMDGAEQMATSMIESMKPVCNMQHVTRLRTTVGTNQVRRMDTGEVYDTASQAARMNNVSRQSMSNHLNRRTGYVTVGGIMFERVE